MVAPGSLFLSAISYYSASVARAFYRQNVDVRLLLIRHLCPRFLYPGRDHVGRYDLSVLRLGDIPARETLDWFTFPSIWVGNELLLQQRPQILLLQWWTSIMAHNYLALAHRAKRLGCRVVLELHELRDVGEHGIPFAGMYTNLMMTKMAKYTDGIVVHSSADKHAVARSYPCLGRHPSTVIFHGPQEHGTAASPGPSANPAPEAKHLIRFLYFGVIRPYKGLPELIQAFGMLVQEGLPVHLTVAGEPWSGEKEPLTELQRCGPEHYSLLLRYLPDKDVTALFANTDILVAPYRRVSASGPISMAMAAGIPIVTTRLPALLEACEAYGGVEWADISSPFSLAAAMKRALRRVGVSYRNPHDWDTNANRYLEFFSKILSTRTGHAAQRSH